MWYSALWKMELHSWQVFFVSARARKTRTHSFSRLIPALGDIFRERKIVDSNYHGELSGRQCVFRIIMAS